MDKKRNKKPTFEFWEVLVITIVASTIMSLSTGYVVFRSNKIITPTSNKNIDEFIKSYNNITSNYYDSINENALIDAAINGMLNYLNDPYTTYLNENNTNILTDSLSGTYEGIGIEVGLNEESKIEIKTVFPDGPSYKAGIMPGDIITKINDVDVTEKDTTEAVNIIKSSKEKDIKIELTRNNESINVVVTKQTLYVPNVESSFIVEKNKNIGYISIEKFTDTIYEQFNKELTKLELNNLDALIIDLRNNTGGYLSGATKIAELFLEKGKIIYTLENKLSKDTTRDSTEEKREYKVYILVNNGSASASEILAGALKHSYGATLIGTRTYGKGKVQKTSNLSDGTMYKYTSAKWLMPNGECIDEIGIYPDLNVELSEEYSSNPILENDNQYQMALYEITK